jgi:hypothetical protein
MLKREYVSAPSVIIRLFEELLSSAAVLTRYTKPLARHDISTPIKTPPSRRVNISLPIFFNIKKCPLLA